MRVLIIPELYRPREASANATLNDAVTWVKEWLRFDETIHVYWLLPHRGTANYEREYVLADRDRVTLIEADHFMAESNAARLFTDSGYTENQLLALKRDIYDELGYVDIVVDQLRQGRQDLLRWLLSLSGHRANEPNPLDVIVNVHDLMLPYKYPEDGSRDDYHRKMEMAQAVLADGCWFKARWDASELPFFASQFLQPSVIREAMDTAVMTDSPIDFTQFEERYRTRPQWLHIAGSGWKKKHQELIVGIGRDLYERYGIRTVITSMEDIPDKYTQYPWVEAYPKATRAEYEQMLRRGDLAICATEYDTLARTWFEQAASGQVLLVRDEPWVHECIISDSPLVVPVEQLKERARWAVENWNQAVAANRRLVEHIREVRSPDRAGRKTHQDMAWRVDEKVKQYADQYRARGAERSTIDQTIQVVDSESLSLDELSKGGAEFTRDGKPLLAHDWCSITDLVFSLRARGYRDIGNAGTPVFQQAANDRIGESPRSNHAAGGPSGLRSGSHDAPSRSN